MHCFNYVVLFFSGANGVVHLWDLGSARMVGELQAHDAAITTLGYSSDGTLLVSASQDHTLKFWNPGSTQARSLSLANQFPLHVHETYYKKKTYERLIKKFKSCESH